VLLPPQNFITKSLPHISLKQPFVSREPSSNDSLPKAKTSADLIEIFGFHDLTIDYSNIDIRALRKVKLLNLNIVKSSYKILK